jgi:hypothetical protein
MLRSLVWYKLINSSCFLIRSAFCPKMDAVHFLEISFEFCQTQPRHIKEDGFLHFYIAWGRRCHQDPIASDDRMLNK